MDISVEDNEKTLTMIDPFFGEKSQDLDTGEAGVGAGEAGAGAGEAGAGAGEAGAGAGEAGTGAGEAGTGAGEMRAGVGEMGAGAGEMGAGAGEMGAGAGEMGAGAGEKEAGAGEAGAGAGEAGAGAGETASTRAEDNKAGILKALEDAFGELTNVQGLQSFLSLFSRMRVMVSVDKLVELNGDRCMAAEGETLCGQKLTYSGHNVGSRVEIVWNCCKGHHKKWESSEILGVKNNSNIYLNDSLQAAALIISGNNYSKFSLLAKALNLNLISANTFLHFQKHCAAPVVRDTWSHMNRLIVEILKKYDDLCLCGDGLNDSPGHCARYCVYTLMEHATKVVVDFEVLDNRETGGNSVAMEREGLRRLLERLATTLPFSELVTDASTTIMKLVREIKGTVNA